MKLIGPSSGCNQLDHIEEMIYKGFCDKAEHAGGYDMCNSAQKAQVDKYYY